MLPDANGNTDSTTKLFLIQHVKLQIRLHSNPDNIKEK